MKPVLLLDLIHRLALVSRDAGRANVSLLFDIWASQYVGKSALSVLNFYLHSLHRALQ